MQYDRVACSCHTASTLLSGQKHWKCDCHRGPFYKVAVMLTMATRPTMGFPLRWVSASSGFTLSIFTCKKFLNSHAPPSHLRWSLEVQSCLSTALDCRPAIRFATACAIGLRCSFEDLVPSPGPPQIQLVELEHLTQ